MTLGQAIEWMLAHPVERLVDSDGDYWWFVGDDTFRVSRYEDMSGACANPCLPCMLSMTFEVPRDERAKSPPR